ncbi:MAG: hypothetical protein NW226_05010 [Microscillaceae bacterium]|nr:hypothetical protein [Microscillaceae bacterium]
MMISKQTKHILGILILCTCSLNHTLAQFKPPRILEHPTQIRTEILTVLNSTYRETNISISPDGKYLFFMSGRGQMPWSNPFYHTYKGRPEHDGDIWFSVRAAGKWQYPQCLSATVNTSQGEDEPNISPDGQIVHFQSWRNSWRRDGGPYYQSSRYANQWNNPRGLGGGITQFFMDLQDHGEPWGSVATDGATLSADGNTFIVAAGKDYSGNMDLYISRKSATGFWAYPRRLSVSTLGNERSPFLTADGKTLYFASDGYGGWGGLDILKTTIREDNSHDEIVNLGRPFNTWLDDYGFTLTATGDDAYFVREGDIYYADTKESSPELKPNNATLIIAGIITNSKTQKGTSANIVIKSVKDKKIIAQAQSNALTGEYAIVLPITATDIIQEVSKTGFTPASKNHQVIIKTGLNTIQSDVALSPVGTPDVLVNNDPPKEVVKEAAADFGKEENVLENR